MLPAFVLIAMLVCLSFHLILCLSFLSYLVKVKKNSMQTLKILLPGGSPISPADRFDLVTWYLYGIYTSPQCEEGSIKPASQLISLKYK